MKIAKIVVDSCSNCPRSKIDSNITRRICGITNKTVCWLCDEDTTPIPNWCQLEDLEE